VASGVRIVGRNNCSTPWHARLLGANGNVVDDDAAPPDGWRQVMHRDGDVWTIVFAGRTCQLHDVRGLRYLAHLLARPHQRIASSEIEGIVGAAPAPDPARVDPAAAGERARVNVTRALSAALRRLEPHHPELVQHLRATLRAGASCTYTPDPRLPATWET
jgi:hypothetical protein